MLEAKEAESQDQTLAIRLGLPAELTVVHDAESDRVYQQLLSGSKFPLAAHEYLLQNLPWHFGFALGVYASFAGYMHLIGCIILVNWWAVVRHQWLVGAANFRPGFQGRLPLLYKMIIHEDGIQEFDRGVESRFGWDAINLWYLWHSILFIHLKNGTYAILPQKGVQPSTFKVEELCSLLKIKGVPGMKLKDD